VVLVVGRDGRRDRPSRMSFPALRSREVFSIKTENAENINPHVSKYQLIASQIIGFIVL